MIFSFVIPHFLASVMAQHPNVPVVITTEAGRRVMATCALAAAQGVQPGMTPREAQALSPQAELVAYDTTRHREAVERLLTVLAEFTNQVEHEAQHEFMRRRNRSTRTADTRQVAVFYADMGRLALKGTLQLAPQMLEAIRHYNGLQASLGIAPAKFTAFAAASATEPGQTRVVRKSEADTFLAPLPIALLWLDAETHRRLILLGLKTLGLVAGLSRSAMYSQFGRRGIRFWELCQGLDLRPVEQYHPQREERLTWHFDAPIMHRGALESVLRTLGEALAKQVQRRGMMGNTVIVTAVLGDLSRRTAKRTLRQHIASTPMVIAALLEAFSRIYSGSHGISGFELTLTDLIPFAGMQLPLFAQPGTNRDRLTPALESLTTRFGVETCCWIEPADKESMLRERRYALVPVLA